MKYYVYFMKENNKPLCAGYCDAENSIDACINAEFALIANIQI